MHKGHPQGHSGDIGMGMPRLSIDQRHLQGPNPDLPKLQNIVSTAFLEQKLNLLEIARRGRNVEYKPKRFAAAIMRIRDPKTTALIFASGKMVCTGAKSEEESETATKQYARLIRRVVGNKEVKMSQFTI